ncbi:MAG: ornithine carbamoyltransferase [Acidimicrobiales bacterium]
MEFNLRSRNFLKLIDFSPLELTGLVRIASELKREQRAKVSHQRLEGRHLALIFQKPSTRTRSAFEVAAAEEGARLTYLGPGESHIGHKESIKDSARVLGRFFDGIEFRGFAHETLEEFATYAGVPVWNGLTDQWHPTQALADAFTMLEIARKPPSEITFCYLGDGNNNVARSLLIMGASFGMDVRIVAPRPLWPDENVRSHATSISQQTGAKLSITESLEEGLPGVDFIYTDVWVSMGAPVSQWGARIESLLPYQVNQAAFELTGKAETKFMHCLPALHNRETEVGQELFSRFGVAELEVTDEIFESNRSVVFEQAVNRLHVVKAIMIKTLAT